MHVFMHLCRHSGIGHAYMHTRMYTGSALLYIRQIRYMTYIANIIYVAFITCIPYIT